MWRPRCYVTRSLFLFNRQDENGGCLYSTGERRRLESVAAGRCQKQLEEVCVVAIASISFLMPLVGVEPLYFVLCAAQIS